MEWKKTDTLITSAHLDYFLSFNTQLNIFGSQAALDFFGGRPVRHINFDKNLLHGLVPGSPGRLAGDNTAPLLKVHRHAAVLLWLTA